MVEITDIINALEERKELLKGQKVVAFTQDRADPDGMGSAAIMHQILRKKYEASVQVVFSKEPMFLMNRHMANQLLGSVVSRAEKCTNLNELIAASPLYMVFDTTDPGEMLEFDRVFELKNGKEIFVYDHHQSNNVQNKHGFNGQKNVHQYVFDVGANTSIMVCAMKRAGVELKGEDQEDQKIAVAAYLGISIDTRRFHEKLMTPYDYEAKELLESVLAESSKKTIEEFLRRNDQPPLLWKHYACQAFEKWYQNERSRVVVYGTGLITDVGIIPFVATQLKEIEGVDTAIVFGLVYEQDDDGKVCHVSLNGSGRTTENNRVSLEQVFGKVFTTYTERGVKIAKGGGRTSGVLGDLAWCGADVPLSFAREYSVDELKMLWTIEAQKYVRKFAAYVPELGANKILIEQGNGHGSS